MKGTMQERLDQKKKRLAAYLEREQYMLSDKAVQSYGIDGRSIQRYETSLAEIRRAIAALEAEVIEIEGLLSGESPRKSVRVIPRDW